MKIWFRSPARFFLTPILILLGFGAALPSDALETVRHLAIQHNGRVKPFDSFAWEILDQVTGAPRFGKEDPVETVLSIVSNPSDCMEKPLIHVPFLPLREALGLDRKMTHISYNEIISTRKLMRMLPEIAEKQQRNEKLSMLENETWDVYGRFVALNGLFEQELNLVPPARVGERVWLPILKPEGHSEPRQESIVAAWESLREAASKKDPQILMAASDQLSSVLKEANPPLYPAQWRLRLEVIYNHVAPFKVARSLYLLGGLAFLLGLSASKGRFSAAGTILTTAAFVIHGAGILIRVVLAGRPPVANFYETMLWLPFVAVLLSLIFDPIYRVRYFELAAGLLAAITLALADHLPLDPSITPIVAVLRSNLWLTIHVLTIVASYGALSLATMLAHLYAGFYLAGRGEHPALPSLGLFLYRAIQVGVVLLASGIMLGGVWANASWGRYWGWDPKETWALITLLWFLAVLHGRFAGWIKGVGVALSTIGGFFLLLMTYYGVSFYLVGLHSYAGGHAKPLPPLLIAYLVVELLFMLAVGAVALGRKRFLKSA